MKNVVLALLVVQLLFGLWHLVGSAALKTLTPEALIGFRAFVSTPLLFWMARRSGLRLPRGKEGPLLITLGVLIIPGNQLLYANGLALAGPLNASVLIMLTPIFTLVGVLLIGQERFSWRKVLGILLAFTGAMGVIGLDQFTTEGAGWGNVLLVAAAAAYGCYLIVGRAVFPSIGFLPGIAWVFFLGGIASSPWTLPEVLDAPWSGQPASFYSMITFIVLGATIGTYALNAYALSKGPGTLVGIFIAFQPLLVVALSPFWGEPVKLVTVAWGIPILGGILLCIFESPDTAKPPAASEPEELCEGEMQ